MSLIPITEQEMKTAGVSSLPARPTAPREFGGKGLTAQEMKEAFDRLPRLVAARYNTLLAHIKDGKYLKDIPYEDAVSLKEFLETLDERLMAEENFTSAADTTLNLHTDTIQTHGTALETLVSDVADLQAETSLVTALILGSAVTKVLTEDTFSARQTADGMNIIDNAKTTVSRISGATVSHDGKLYHARFAGIKSTGRNLYHRSYSPSQTYRGVTFTVDNENGGTFTAKGTATDQIWFRPITSSTQLASNIKQDAAFQFTCFQRRLDVSNAPAVASAMFEYTNVLGNRHTAWDNNTSSLLPHGFSSGWLQIGISQGDTVDLAFSPIVVWGTVRPTTWEAYKDDTSFMTDTPVELGVWDYIDVERQKVVRQTATLSFDGTEAWYDITPDGTGGYFALEIAGITASSVCSAYPHAVAESVDGYWCLPIDSIFAIKDSAYTTVEAWKAHLGELANAGTPLAMAYQTTATEENITLPSGYTAWQGGSETIEQGDTDTAKYGAVCTVAQTYYMAKEEATA